MSESEWWTVPEAAKALKVSENAVYAAIRAGQIPTLHVGTQPRISPVALSRWTLERMRRPQENRTERDPDGMTLVCNPPPTTAPTAPTADRVTPKHIRTAEWRRAVFGADS